MGFSVKRVAGVVALAAAGLLAAACGTADTGALSKGASEYGAVNSSQQAPAVTDDGDANVPHPCLASALRTEHVRTTASETMGTGELVATNIGGTACTVDGYPKMTMQDGNGRVLPVDVANDNAPSPETVIIEPGKAAVINMRWALSAENCGAHGNPDVEPQQIEVVAPGANSVASMTFQVNDETSGDNYLSACSDSTVHVSGWTTN